MNSMNKSALVQALGYGLAGAAAATLASKTANRARPRFSPLGFLSGRRRPQNPFRRTLAGALFSAPLLGNLIGGRSVKRDLLRSALLGLGAGLGTLAAPQKRGVLRRGILGTRLGRGGSGLATVGRLLAGGIVAATASKLLNRTLRDRYTHEPHSHERTLRDRFDHEPHTNETRDRGRQTHEQSGY
jgi:hypothetical protein